MKITPAFAKRILIEAATKHGAEHEADKILSALAEQRAFLFVSRAQDGFVVLRFKGALCWVDFAYCNKPGAFRRYLGELLDIATKFGCNSVGFETRRKGYFKVMPGYGFNCVKSHDDVFEWRIG